MKWIRCLVAVVILVFAESKSFRSDYEYYEDVDGWFKFHRIPAVWHEAQLRCHMEGSILASPINANMASALKNFIRTKGVEDCGVLTGVHATFSNGDFFSIEGVPLSAMPVEWLPYEPNNFNNEEQCIAFIENGTIGDVDCNKVFPYVCFHKHTDAAVTACGTTDPEYVLNPKTGSCYKFHRNTRPWKRAFMSCAAEGGYLAIPNSEEEAKIMKEIFEKNPSNKIIQVHEGIMRDIMHIGFHDWNERADWRTIQGVPLIRMAVDWMARELDNSLECLKMLSDSSNIDVSCSRMQCVPQEEDSRSGGELLWDY